MKHQRSSSYQQSLSEFGFILFFVFAAASAIMASQLFTRMEELKEMVLEVNRLEQEKVRLENQVVELDRKIWGMEIEISRLEQSNRELEAELERYRFGNVPCHQRPGTPVHPISIVVTIINANEILVQHNQNAPIRLSFAPRQTPGFRMAQQSTMPEATVENRAQALRNAISQLLVSEFGFASTNNCYVRGRIVNNTESFSLYEEVLTVYRGFGIIVPPI